MTSERRLRRVTQVARGIIASSQHWRNVDWARGASTDETGSFVDDKRALADLDEAEVVSSKVMGWRSGAAVVAHRPLIDIDFPAAVVPSTTPGHSHLYIDKQMPWEDLEKLLTVMAEVGLVEKGFLEASRKRQCTFLRLPWIRKGHEKHDARVDRGWKPEEIEEFLGVPALGPDPWLGSSGPLPF